MLSGKKFTDICESVNLSDEALYQNASDILFKLISDPEKTNKEKLIYVLELGLAYYGLDTAVVSSITGNSYAVNEVISSVTIPFEKGDVLELCNTPTESYFGIDSYHCFAQQEPHDVFYKNGSKQEPVLSYISSMVETVNGPFGSVCFSSSLARGANFNPLDERLLVQIAGWLGILLGQNEQLEISAAQNDHYRTLFASVPAMMFLCDIDGLIISSSDKFARQIGMDVDAVPGKVCIKYFHSNDKSTVRKLIMEGQGVCVPVKLLRDGQEELEVELSVSVKPIGTMQNIRMVLAADVSARNAAFRVVTEQNRLLEAANENLNQFAYAASHDLQEPLRKIQLFSDFLEEDLGDTLSGESKNNLNIIVSASKRMSKLIEDLLRYSRTSSIEPEMGEVNLTTLVNATVSDLEHIIQDSDATVHVSELPTVVGNEPLLRQLFTNLICNAIKYRKATQSPMVRVFGSDENGQQQVIVADNGIGFESQYAEKIFEPFKRLHTTEQYKGTGIGLAICATVCEKHGWDINACNNEDGGSSFAIGVNDEKTNLISKLPDCSHRC